MSEVYEDSRRLGRFVRKHVLVAAAAIATIAGARSLRAADILLNSFELGGFDTAGDPDATATPFQTVGVTDGQFSLKVDSTNTSWWNDYGHINVNVADVLSKTTLKWDVTTSTGVQIVPIFLPNAGSFYYQGSGISVPPSASPQTMSFDYSSLNLPGDATSMQIRFQGSNGSPISFYMDNVRVGSTVTLTNANATWKTNGNGDWTDSANWNPSIPGLPGSQANFNTNGGAITTTNQIVVNLGQPVTVQNMNFDKGGGGYKVAGGSQITVSANINVLSGNHVVAAPVNLANAGIIDIAAGSSLTLNNLGGGGFGLFQKEGPGTLNTDKVVNVSIQVNNGTWNLLPGNVQNNGWIYDIFLDNSTTFNINDAKVINNSISTGTNGGGTIVIGAGGQLTTALYGGSEVFAVLAGAGNVQIGGSEGTADVATFSAQNTYTGSTKVMSGDTLVVNTRVGTGALTADNGTVTFTAGNAAPHKVASVSVANNGIVDLNDNDMIITASNYDAVKTVIASARNGGSWNGSGLTSTTARNAFPKITNLGAITGAQFHQAAGAGALFDGQVVANTDVLVKYTYNGDTDLNGIVNFDDYSRTDAGFNSGGSDWFHGDFDFNGIVNFDDYSLIDAAFNQQGGSLRRMLAYLDGNDRDRSTMNTPELQIVVQHFDQFGLPYAQGVLNSVPEPGSLSAVGGVALLGLRRRRRIN
jgi:hypothetical protein